MNSPVISIERPAALKGAASLQLQTASESRHTEAAVLGCPICRVGLSLHLPTGEYDEIDAVGNDGLRVRAVATSTGHLKNCVGVVRMSLQSLIATAVGRIDNLIFRCSASCSTWSMTGNAPPTVPITRHLQSQGISSATDTGVCPNS